MKLVFGKNMISIRLFFRMILFCLIAVFPLLVRASDSEDFSCNENGLPSMTYSVDCYSEVDANNWDISKLDFKAWITAVSIPGWTTVVSESTENIYFLVQKNEGRIVIWSTPRNLIFKSNSFNVIASPCAGRVVDSNCFAKLDVKINYPEGWIGAKYSAIIYNVENTETGKLRVVISSRSGGRHKGKMYSKDVEF